MKRAILFGFIAIIGAGSYYFYATTSKANERDSFFTYVCPKIEPMHRFCKGNGSDCVPVPFTVDCECAFKKYQTGLTSTGFSQFLAISEEAIKSNARRLYIPDPDLKKSVRAIFRDVEDICIKQHK